MVTGYRCRGQGYQGQTVREQAGVEEPRRMIYNSWRRRREQGQVNGRTLKLWRRASETWSSRNGVQDRLHPRYTWDVTGDRHITLLQKRQLSPPDWYQAPVPLRRYARSKIYMWIEFLYNSDSILEPSIHWLGYSPPALVRSWYLLPVTVNKRLKDLTTVRCPALLQQSYALSENAYVEMSTWNESRHNRAMLVAED